MTTKVILCISLVANIVLAVFLFQNKEKYETLVYELSTTSIEADISFFNMVLSELNADTPDYDNLKKKVEAAIWGAEDLKKNINDVYEISTASNKILERDSEPASQIQSPSE